jgi:uracil-DNA glycosylase family 4
MPEFKQSFLDKMATLDVEPRRVGRGSLNASFVFLGEAPKPHEHKTGTVFEGNGGKLLDAVAAAVGINLKKDAYYTTALMQPIKGANATVQEIKRDRPSLKETLEKIKPKVVVALGAGAFKALMDRNVPIGDVRGFTFWSKEFNCYVVPTYSPNAVLMQPSMFDDFARDFQKVIQAKDIKPGGIKQKNPQYVLCKSVNRAKRILQAMTRMKNVVSCDIETDGFDYWTQDILEIGFGTSDLGGVIFPQFIIERPDIQEMINEVFRNPDIIFVFQNGKFDLQYLWADPNPAYFSKEKKVIIRDARMDYDTMYAHYCTDERTATHGLKLWAREEFDAPDWDADIKKYLPNKNTPYSAIPANVRAQYHAYDLMYTRKGYFRFNEKMEKEGTRKCFDEIMMPSSIALAETELYGVLLDVKQLQQIAREATPKIEEARIRLEKASIKAGWTPEGYVEATGAREVPKFFNPKSPKQMQWVGYTLCNMPLFEGKKTCAKDAVEAYQFRHPWWKALAEYKQIADLFGTYVKGMLERVDPDGRIRPDFLLHGTVTGRLSCHNPNLQNIPRKSFVKKLFMAPEDSVIVNVDYKTLEVVVAAILSDDKEMQRPFIEGEDFHMNTTKDVFGDDLAMLREWVETKDIQKFIGYLQRSMMLEIRIPGFKYLYDMKDEDDMQTWTLKDKNEIEFLKLEDLIVDYLRFLTKFITFGIMYGRKAPSLAYGELNCSVAEAERYIKNFHKKYPDFYRWMKNQEKTAVSQGYITTPFGRKRRWGFINNDNIYKVHNQSVNTPIQGTASDICLKAFTRLHFRFKEENFRLGRCLWLVHDAIVFEIKRAHLQEALDVIREEMTVQPMDSIVPFEIDIEVGERYGSVEKVVKKDGRWVHGKENASTFLKEMMAV